MWPAHPQVFLTMDARRFVRLQDCPDETLQRSASDDLPFLTKIAHDKCMSTRQSIDPAIEGDHDGIG